MTRKPIFIGVASILALTLTAGLAYGAGRMVGTRGPGNQGGGQQRTVGVVPGHSFGQQTQAGFRSGMGFGNQRRGWMGSHYGSSGWMSGQYDSRGWTGQRSFAGHSRYSQRGTQTVSSGGYNGSGHGDHYSGYHHGGSMGPGSWGNGSGYHHDDCCGWC